MRHLCEFHVVSVTFVLACGVCVCVCVWLLWRDVGSGVVHQEQGCDIGVTVVWTVNTGAYEVGDCGGWCQNWRVGKDTQTYLTDGCVDVLMRWCVDVLSVDD
jgi:hypothetical protein